jgi:plasmid stabilization system protein ParE
LREDWWRDVRSAFDLLARMPNIGSARFARFFGGKDIRCWTLRHFPFRIFYIVDGGELQIVAVEHVHRDVPPSLTI